LVLVPARETNCCNIPAIAALKRGGSVLDSDKTTGKSRKTGRYRSTASLKGSSAGES